MNNTKWNEIFKSFFSRECDEHDININIPWMTKCHSNGFIYGWDYTWIHFGAISPGENNPRYDDIEWLKIKLTDKNRDFVLSALSNIHVPGEVDDDCVTVYGYPDKYLDYIKYSR